MCERRELLSFAAPVAYAAYQSSALVSADMNGDSKPDLISLRGGNVIDVRLSNADGTFGSLYEAVASGAVVSGYTGDALAVSVRPGVLPEIVLATSLAGADGSIGPEPTDGLAVLQFNSSNGTFTGGQTSYSNIFPTASPITSLALAAVNPNFPGALYAVAADESGVYVAPVAPHGEAPPAQTYGFPPFPISGYGLNPLHVAVGDFNGDGQPDIVAAGYGYACVYRNNGDGTFAAPQTYALNGSPTSNAVAVGDFNRDGKPDIVTANSDSTMSVLLNNGDGTFGPARNYAIGGPANSVAVGDFNHDGNLDVATTGAEMDVLLNHGDGTFGAYQTVGPAGSLVVAGDFNGDGFSDLAQIDASQNSIDVSLDLPYGMVGPVSLSFGGITFNKKTKVYSETVTLTNITSGPLTGPWSLELTALPSGVVLTDATGTTNGNPYIRFLDPGTTLQQGASVTITLTFTARSPSQITFGTEVVGL
jgi:hypothetical protein